MAELVVSNYFKMKFRKTKIKIFYEVKKNLSIFMKFRNTFLICHLVTALKVILVQFTPWFRFFWKHLGLSDLNPGEK